MLNSVIITDLTKAVKMSYKSILDQNLWVTAIDPVEDEKVLRMHNRMRRQGAGCHREIFFDWCDSDPDPYVVANIETMGPQQEHINRIVTVLHTYITGTQQIDLGVNCYAGVSRSTAIGMIAWCIAGKDPEDALKRILTVRYQAWPNLRMLKLADNKLRDLGYDSHMYDYVLEWKKGQRMGLWIPYLPEK